MVGLSSHQFSGRATLSLRMWLHSFWNPMEMAACALHLFGFLMRMYDSNERLDSKQ